jgi:hypothetical protein
MSPLQKYRQDLHSDSRDLLADRCSASTLRELIYEAAISSPSRLFIITASDGHGHHHRTLTPSQPTLALSPHHRLRGRHHQRCGRRRGRCGQQQQVSCRTSQRHWNRRAVAEWRRSGGHGCGISAERKLTHRSIFHRPNAKPRESGRRKPPSPGKALWDGGGQCSARRSEEVTVVSCLARRNSAVHAEA